MACICAGHDVRVHLCTPFHPCCFLYCLRPMSRGWEFWHLTWKHLPHLGLERVLGRPLKFAGASRGPKHSLDAESIAHTPRVIHTSPGPLALRPTSLPEGDVTKADCWGHTLDMGTMGAGPGGRNARHGHVVTSALDMTRFPHKEETHRPHRAKLSKCQTRVPAADSGLAQARLPGSGFYMWSGGHSCQLCTAAARGGLAAAFWDLWRGRFSWSLETFPDPPSSCHTPSPQASLLPLPSPAALSPAGSSHHSGPGPRHHLHHQSSGLSPRFVPNQGRPSVVCGCVGRGPVGRIVCGSPSLCFDPRE